VLHADGAALRPIESAGAHPAVSVMASDIQEAVALLKLGRGLQPGAELVHFQGVSLKQLSCGGVARGMCGGGEVLKELTVRIVEGLFLRRGRFCGEAYEKRNQSQGPERSHAGTFRKFGIRGHDTGPPPGR
jgi:hypothetical protein